MEDSHTDPSTGRRATTPWVPPPTLRPRPGRRRRRALLAPVVVAVAVGLSGCGGGDDVDTGASLTAEDARNADSAAKLAARELSETVEDCFRGTRDYGRCTTARELGSTRATLTARRPVPGEATVSRGTRTGYRILTVSLSGNRFAITRQGSDVIRSCAARTPLGRSGGGCPGNGW